MISDEFLEQMVINAQHYATVDNVKDMAQELLDARQKTELLRNFLLSQKGTEHYECEDCWYSCPKSGECCDDRLGKDVCTCGLDKRNEEIDAVLREVENANKN